MRLIANHFLNTIDLAHQDRLGNIRATKLTNKYSAKVQFPGCAGHYDWRVPIDRSGWPALASRTDCRGSAILHPLCERNVLLRGTKRKIRGREFRFPTPDLWHQKLRK